MKEQGRVLQDDNTPMPQVKTSVRHQRQILVLYIIGPHAGALPAELREQFQSQHQETANG